VILLVVGCGIVPGMREDQGGICGNCGASIVPGDRFCTTCGASTEGAVIAAVPAPGPPVTTGPPVIPVDTVDLSQSPEANERGPSRSRWIIIAAVIVLAAGATAVVVKARGDDSTSGSAGAGQKPTFALPRSVDNEAWSVDIDELGGWRIDGSQLFVTSNFSDPELASLSLASGDEQWSVDLDVESVSVGLVVDGHVLLTASDNAGADSLMLAIDAKTGEEQWRQDADPVTLTKSGDRVLSWQYGTKTTVEVIDPATGDSEKRFRYDQISEQNGRLVAIDDDQLRQFSLDSLDEIGEPIPWDTDYSAFLVGTNGVYVINEGDDLIRLDQSGKEVWNASTGDDQMYFLTDLGNGLIAVAGGEGTTVGRENGDDFEEVWNSDGSIGSVFKVGGTVVATIYDEADLDFVDAATGDEFTSVEVNPETLNLWPATNGAIVRLSDDSAEFAALSLPSGDELWRISEDFGSIEPFDGGVLVFTSDNLDSTETTITRRN
jgi:PQQ-like domain/zinc-ribbon domain